MATKKIVLNGPFFLHNKLNKKYPPGVIAKDCHYDSEYLKITFWKNEDFMSRLDAITTGDGIQFILRNHIASLGMNTNDFQRCNFDNDALEKAPKEEAIRLTLLLVKRHSLERKKNIRN